MKRYVAVIGAGVADELLSAQAEEVGRLLGQENVVLLSGGLGGVMEAACRGARSTGGTTVALLPSIDRAHANQYVDVALPTGMGEMRNALIVRAADVVIAIGGEYGTLSEVAFALKTDTPVVGLGTWGLLKDDVRVHAFPQASSPRDAVTLALDSISP
ncbi:MAG: TIGR00725 family protein [Actinomycetota bacterium]|nr:TIGR00725 family protein [Actinomycetota bacterium]